jgi:2,3-bisphosphoglycerate-dependent phosphoglycerate mutase
VEPNWDPQIAPRLKAGDDVLIAAHGNYQRAIDKKQFAEPDDQIDWVEIPTGNPLEIQLDLALKPTAARYLDADRAETLPTLP